MHYSPYWRGLPTDEAVRGDGDPHVSGYVFGKGASWGMLPGNPPALWVMVGGIGEKPGVVDGQIAVRDYLSLTISFDQDIIDGAPAARFT